MWSSDLPTGTIQTERRAGRTFPRSDSQPRRAEPKTGAGRSRAAPHAEIERLRAENRQLESQVDSLRSKVERHQADTQAIVDRYEQVITELEQTAATALTESAGPQDSRATGPARTDGGLIQQLQRWL